MRYLVAVWFVLFSAIARAESPSFRHVVIDPNAGRICYAVTAADVNNDERPDIVVVTDKQVLWYEAPGWTKHVMLDGGTIADNVCIAPFDIDQDGQIDFALGAGWTKTGTIQWISADEGIDKPWVVHPIAVEPWTHRMRWISMLGKPSVQLVVSPLNASKNPNGARLLAFEVPKNPRTNRWREHELGSVFNRMHNHWSTQVPGSNNTSTLTASAEGIHRIKASDDGWSIRKLHTATQGDTPAESGAGEIKTGALDDVVPFTRIMATIEPMHGTKVVVYRLKYSPGETWEREVIFEGLKRGHGLWTADLFGDKSTEIIVGHSDQTPDHPEIKPGVRVFSFDDQRKKWNCTVIDNGGVAVEDLIAEDFTGDGKPDIVACGRATHNVKLYVNEGE